MKANRSCTGWEFCTFYFQNLHCCWNHRHTSGVMVTSHPLSPCQRIFQLEKEKLPSGIIGEKKKLEEILCSQVVSIRKIYWWPRVHKAQVWCQVPNIKVGNVSFPILHSQPFPLSLTPSRADFDFHSSTKQLFAIISPYKNLGTFVSTFSRVEVAFNSHGFSYTNI